MSSSIEMLPMFYANRRIANTSKAAGFLPREQCREMVEARLATWTKGCRGIMLRKVDAEMWRPAPSLKPGVQVMDAYVEGTPTAVAIIHSYAAMACGA